MKKKTLALLLSLTLAAGMIGGCGSKTETTTEENVQTAQTEAVAETGTETVWCRQYPIRMRQIMLLR